MRILTNILFILFCFSFLYGQESENYFYLSPSFGRTNSDNSDFNSGITFAILDWPHLYSVNFSSQYRFPIPEGNWENEEEFSIKYNYLIQPFGWQKFFTGFGSGLALVNRIHKMTYVTDEISKDQKVVKLGIPIEFKIGFLYPKKNLRLVDLAFFKVFNSIKNYSGWKLGFNITL